ncbi:MAG TPA: glycosyltransferase family A protein [Moraxellaceae bacterium]|nr:glycosyltransferase family A protein [Moraxellaceae bacterium]
MASRRISTIIATRDQPAALVSTLGSLFRQQRPPDEVIVVDDGSGPDTPHALQHWRSRQPFQGPVLRYRYQTAQGGSAAFNQGVADSSGDLLLFMAGEALLEAEALRHLEDALSTAPASAVAVASLANLHARGQWPAATGPTVTPPEGRPSQRLADLIAGHWVAPLHGCLFTREAVSRIGPWDSRFRLPRVDDLLFRAVLRGVEFLPAPEALAYCRAEERTAVSGHLSRGDSTKGLDLKDDLAIHDQVFLELRARGAHERMRAAFEAWHRALGERYGEAWRGVNESDWSVLSWLATVRPEHPRGRVTLGRRTIAQVSLPRTLS